MATIFRKCFLHQIKRRCTYLTAFFEQRFSAFSLSTTQGAHISLLDFFLHNEACLPKAKFKTSATQSSVNPISMSYTSFKSTHPDVLPGKSPIVIMHGLFGSKTNWRSLAKALSVRTKRIVYTVDARNHGESPHTDDLDYISLSEDVAFFLEERKISQAHLIGHSMGGRAMMALALLHPNLIEKLFILDISPINRPNTHSNMMQFVEVMRSTEIPSHLQITEGRKYVDDALKAYVEEAAVRNFLLANLLKTSVGFRWKVNLDAVYNHFDKDLKGFSLENSSKQFTGTTHFLAGSLSKYIKPTDHTLIKKLFPTANFHYIEGAGHWLHADKPQEFLNTIVPLIGS